MIVSLPKKGKKPRKLMTLARAEPYPSVYATELPIPMANERNHLAKILPSRPPEYLNYLNFALAGTRRDALAGAVRENSLSS